MVNPLKKVVLICLSVAIVMFGFTFAMAPLYSMVCKKTGFRTSKLDLTISPDLSRDIIVQLVSINNAELPWDFYPTVTSIHVHPETNTKIFFVAKNNSSHTMTVQAVPSFSPGISGAYFHKIECFCFTKQTLKAHEKISMPVVFRIDNKLPANVHTITLAYTLFDVTANKKEL